MTGYILFIYLLFFFFFFFVGCCRVFYLLYPFLSVSVFKVLLESSTTIAFNHIFPLAIIPSYLLLPESIAVYYCSASFYGSNVPPGFCHPPCLIFFFFFLVLS